MRWMRTIPSFDSCSIAVASNSTAPTSPAVLLPATPGSSRTFSSMSRICATSASMLASTNAAGLLISCATPAASMPIDASFSACRRRTSRSRSSVMSRTNTTARPPETGSARAT